jgi:hypothetical protein
MSDEAILEAARVIEVLLGVPPTVSGRRMTKRERQEQAERVRRFLALPPELQEGVLRYAENMKGAYLSKNY